MTYSVFDTESSGKHLEQPMFFGENVTIARYDKVKYPQFNKLTRQQWGYIWQPEEIPLTRDQKDFKTLSPEEEHIFTSNLKRQILLDSVQGRALSAVFKPSVSLPELETWFTVQEAFETIHNRTYTYLLQNVYPNPSKTFDEMTDIPEIAQCARSVSLEYDRMIDLNVERHAQGWATEWKPPSAYWNIDWRYIDEVQMWRALHALNALEGIRFYVSFVCSWAFAEQGKMEGNAKLIKLIARDENLHLAASQQMIKLLPKDDLMFAAIVNSEAQYISDMYHAVAEQEKAWASYLFRTGAMLGLNEDILNEYIDHRTAKVANAIGVEGFKNTPNPLPWVNKWIAGSEVQVAPQETQITSYVIGGIENDVKDGSFKGFSL